MKQVNRVDYAFGLVLSAVAGWVDVVAFLELGGIYVSFMSGNTLRIGLDVSRSEWSSLPAVSEALACFVAASFCGRVVENRLGRWGWPLTLALEAGLLATAWMMTEYVGLSRAAILLMTTGMGLQNQACAGRSVDNAGLTFITGALFRFGDALARRFAEGERSGHWWRLGLVVTVFFSGAIAGSLCAAKARSFAFLCPAAAVAALAAVALGIEMLGTERPGATPAPDGAIPLPRPDRAP